MGKIFVWNVKGTLWNSTQNIILIHWKICILSWHENVRALRFKCFWNGLRLCRVWCWVMPDSFHKSTHTLPHNGTMWIRKSLLSKHVFLVAVLAIVLMPSINRNNLGLVSILSQFLGMLILMISWSRWDGQTAWDRFVFIMEISNTSIWKFAGGLVFLP